MRVGLDNLVSLGDSLNGFSFQGLLFVQWGGGWAAPRERKGLSVL